MLKSISRFASSFAAFLSDASSSIDAEQRMVDIRAEMLDALSQTKPHQPLAPSRTWYCVAGATDLQTLWYLRSNVLHVLADSQGEQAASARLQTITEMFRGVIPKNQMPVARPGACLQESRAMRASGQTPHA